MSDFGIRIGGDAGQGIEFVGAALSRVLARSGLHVFASQDYRSRIRGGHNFYHVRAAMRPVHAAADPADVLLALTPETISVHRDRLAEEAGVLYEESFSPDPAQFTARALRPMPVPMQEIAARHGSRLMLSAAALGAAAGVAGVSLELVEGVIHETFSAKNGDVRTANAAVAGEAYRYVRARYGDTRFRAPSGDGARRILISGNHALALGALAGGCRFVAAYPMTPATSIIEYVASVSAECGIVTKHAEDEIAAVGMAIGASFAGVRAMTATSGGGFSLMVEALGLAGITEVPLVVVNAQRGGPSTGLPTRTEQGDLLFAVHASQGEFPRIVIAPGTVEECFEAGWRSFNLADQYQCPVIVLTDLFLAGALQTVEPGALDAASVQIDRGALFDGASSSTDGTFQRFALRDDGISPRAFPGDAHVVVRAASDEHDENGHISEEIHNRVAMMRKRMRKEATALRDAIRPPRLYAHGEADATLVCWGSSLGPVREAAELLSGAGRAVDVLHFGDLWPFPAAAAEAALTAARVTICVEQNYTGQLAKLIRMTTGRAIDHRILCYDGRPMSPCEIVHAVERALAGERDVHVEAGEPHLSEHREACTYV